jgi:deazaflavin-dependent oxidoreductase (nitroreductase family)
MNLLRPVAIAVGRLSWLPRFLPQIVWLDRTLHRLSGGRLTLLALAGLPELYLTAPGRRSGLARTTPLLYVPYDGHYLVAGSNWGAPHLPAWVLNLRTAEQEDRDVHAEIRGVRHRVRVREVTGAERGRLWRAMVATWPNYAHYAAGTDRTIPVFELTPG